MTEHNSGMGEEQVCYEVTVPVPNRATADLIVEAVAAAGVREDAIEVRPTTQYRPGADS